MKISFHDWVASKAYVGADPATCVLGLEASFLCMWAINREAIFMITIDNEIVRCYRWENNGWGLCNLFNFKDHNNSEQEALNKVLRYIYQETT